jgi:hypothetical protein
LRRWLLFFPRDIYGSYHFVLMIDGSASAHEVLDHVEVALRGRALQRSVARLKRTKSTAMRHACVCMCAHAHYCSPRKDAAAARRAFKCHLISPARSDRQLHNGRNAESF